MSPDEIETIQLTDTWRLKVVQDYDGQNQRTNDDYMLTGALTINSRWRNTIDVEPIHEFPGPLHGAHIVLQDEQVVIRWAKIFYGIHLDFTDGTYWWVDRGKLEQNWSGDELDQVLAGSYFYTDHLGAKHAISEASIIKDEQEDYRRWCDGEVYGVKLERRIDLYELDDKGVATDREAFPFWEEVESLWGCYLNDDYTAKEVGLQLYAGTDHDVLAALGVKVA